MASDHRGRPLHAGKRTVQSSVRYPRPLPPEVYGVMADEEYVTGRRMARDEFNQMFTHPSDITYDTYEVEGPGGEMYTIEDETKPIKYEPIADYPYQRPYTKTRVTTSPALNPPPKRRSGGTPKVTENKSKGIPKDGKPSDKPRDLFY